MKNLLGVITFLFTIPKLLATRVNNCTNYYLLIEETNFLEPISVNTVELSLLDPHIPRNCYLELTYNKLETDCTDTIHVINHGIDTIEKTPAISSTIKPNRATVTTSTTTTIEPTTIITSKTTTIGSTTNKATTLEPTTVTTPKITTLEPTTVTTHKTTTPEPTTVTTSKTATPESTTATTSKTTTPEPTTVTTSKTTTLEPTTVFTTKTTFEPTTITTSKTTTLEPTTITTTKIILKPTSVTTNNTTTTLESTPASETSTMEFEGTDAESESLRHEICHRKLNKYIFSKNCKERADKNYNSTTYFLCDTVPCEECISRNSHEDRLLRKNLTRVLKHERVNCRQYLIHIKHYDLDGDVLVYPLDLTTAKIEDISCLNYSAICILNFNCMNRGENCVNTYRYETKTSMTNVATDNCFVKRTDQGNAPRVTTDVVPTTNVIIEETVSPIKESFLSFLKNKKELDLILLLILIAIGQLAFMILMYLAVRKVLRLCRKSGRYETRESESTLPNDLY